MKKLFITILLSVAAFAGAFAVPKEVNASILANFEAEFENASNVTWVITKDYTEAGFTIGNVKMEVYYNPNGDIIATSKGISLDKLPVGAKRSFAKKFAGYRVVEAIRFEGFDEAAYYISGENEKSTVILKVNDNGEVSLFKNTKK